jgi:chromosome segregation ATPase
MSEFENATRTHSGALLGALAAALVAALGGLIWSYSLSGRLATQQAELADAKQQNKDLAAQQRETRARLQVATDEISQRLGITEKSMDDRAEALVQRQAAQEAAQEASSKRLESAQQQTAQQVSSVSHEVSSVKSDVGGVRNDLGKTQSELANAVSQLTSMKGDLSDHASLIARNHGELEILKHKGDRNYYEFTLTKGDKRPVGTISIQLKKADAKKSRFNLVIYSDDKSYEKKDKNLNEPLQFYAGKNGLLYEIVVNAVSAKNTVTGYLATPKGAPVPANIP